MAVLSSTSSSTSPMDLGIWKTGNAAKDARLASIINRRLDEIRSLPEIRSRTDMRIELDPNTPVLEAIITKTGSVYTINVSLPFLIRAEEVTDDSVKPDEAFDAADLWHTYFSLDSQGQTEFRAFMAMCGDPSLLEKTKNYILHHEMAHAEHGDLDSSADDDLASCTREKNADLRAARGSVERTDGGIYFHHVRDSCGIQTGPTHPHPRARANDLIAYRAANFPEAAPSMAVKPPEFPLVGKGLISYFGQLKAVKKERFDQLLPFLGLFFDNYGISIADLFKCCTELETLTLNSPDDAYIMETTPDLRMPNLTHLVIERARGDSLERITKAFIPRCPKLSTITIREGLINKDALARVRAEFPGIKIITPSASSTNHTCFAASEL